MDAYYPLKRWHLRATKIEEAYVGKKVVLGLIWVVGELGQERANLVDDTAPWGAGGLRAS